MESALFGSSKRGLPAQSWGEAYHESTAEEYDAP